MSPNTLNETTCGFKTKTQEPPSSSSSSAEGETATTTAERFALIRALRNAGVRNTARALHVPGISVDLIEHAARLVKQQGIRLSGEGANPGLFGAQVLSVLTSGEAAEDLGQRRSVRVREPAAKPAPTWTPPDPDPAIAQALRRVIRAEDYARYFRHQVVPTRDAAGVVLHVPTGFIAELIRARFGALIASELGATRFACGGAS